MPRIRACRLDAIPAEGGVSVELSAGEVVAVFRVGEEVFAIDDVCTHGEASLSDGWLDGDEVECPLHGGRFCVRDGRASRWPAEVDARVYEAVIDGEEVFVDVGRGGS